MTFRRQAYGTAVSNRDMLRLRYLYFDDWLKIHTEMDPDGVFVTAFLRSILGL